MPTIEDLFRAGTRRVRRPEWGPETFLALEPDPADPTRPDATVVLYREGTRKGTERLKLVGGGKSWEPVEE